MSSIVLSGDTSGSVTVSVPAVSGSNTVTIPAVTGTVMVSSNMPAFSAYLGTSQTPTANVLTKILFDIEDFDTNNNFASSRFTPTVAGYYSFVCGVAPSASVSAGGVRFYKNGIGYMVGADFATNFNNANASAIIYCNGSTDYIEIYGYVSTGSFYGHAADSSYPRYTYFQGSLVRGA